MQAFNLYIFASLNSLISDEVLDARYSPDAKNIITQGGLLRTRNGYKLLAPVAQESVNGLTGYYPIGEQELLFAFGDAPYVWDGEVFTEIDTELTPAPWDFEHWMNLLICANGYEVLKHDGVEFASLSNAPVGKYVKVHQERLLIANQSDNPSRLSWSERGNPEGWADDSGDLDVQTNDGDEIKGLHPFDRDTLVYKENTLWIFAGSDPNYYSFQKIGMPGTVSNASISTTLGKPYWLARNGVYTFNGSIPYCISDEIDPHFIQNINQEYIYKAVSTEWKRKYWLAVPWGDSTVNNVILVYDPAYSQWFFYDNMYVSCFGKFWLGNEEVLLFGSENGKVYQGDIGQEDDGEPIDSYWTTPWLNCENPILYKGFTKLRCLVGTDEVKRYLAVSFQKDGGLESDPCYISLQRVNSENPSFRVVQGLRIGAARRVKLKFSGSFFDMKGFSLEYNLLPEREGAL